MKIVIHRAIDLAIRADLPDQTLLLFDDRDGTLWAMPDDGQQRDLVGFLGTGISYQLSDKPCTLLDVANDGTQKLAIYQYPGNPQVFARPLTQFKQLTR